jgi:uncharacterized protein (TIGR03084 family)
MLEQATDFGAESEALFRLLEPLSDAELAQPTLFKGWRIEQIIGHLHLWNLAADHALSDVAQFDAMMAGIGPHMAGGGTLAEYESAWLAGLPGDQGRMGLSGRALLQRWRAQFSDMLARFHAADPKARVKWAGPDMSVRSSITARLMETWAHGQAVYDRLDTERVDTDRIRNIVVLGVNTFGWAYKIRGLAVPARVPYLRLSAPSGAQWTFNEPAGEDTIEGSAAEFCRVVTQTRNVADTALKVSGDGARHWMSIAQCFAGAAHAPPPPGSRHRQRRG